MAGFERPILRQIKYRFTALYVYFKIMKVSSPSEFSQKVNYDCISEACVV